MTGIAITKFLPASRRPAFAQQGACRQFWRQTHIELYLPGPKMTKNAAAAALGGDGLDPTPPFPAAMVRPNPDPNVSSPTALTPNYRRIALNWADHQILQSPRSRRSEHTLAKASAREMTLIRSPCQNGQGFEASRFAPCPIIIVALAPADRKPRRQATGPDEQVGARGEQQKRIGRLERPTRPASLVLEERTMMVVKASVTPIDLARPYFSTRSECGEVSDFWIDAHRRSRSGPEQKCRAVLPGLRGEEGTQSMHRPLIAHILRKSHPKPR